MTFFSPQIHSDSPLLHDGTVPVLRRGHDRNSPHAAEVGAGDPAGGDDRGVAGWGNRDVAGRSLVLLRWNLVVLMQVGGRHGAERRALTSHTGETSGGGDPALWGRNIFSGTKKIKRDKHTQK